MNSRFTLGIKMRYIFLKLSLGIIFISQANPVLPENLECY